MVDEAPTRPEPAGPSTERPRSAPADDAASPDAPLDWTAERADWPHAEASRFVDAHGLRWHVQILGAGPPILLLHGTGASTHSWRDLAPLLARRFTVVAPDLPGHGFTARDRRRAPTLPFMADAVAALAGALDLRPRAVVGHSAGAAIAIRCALDGTLVPDIVIGINAALLPFRGSAGVLFPPLAKLLFLNPLTPRLFARSAANRQRVARLIRGTGSSLGPDGIELYARLFSHSAHVAATLGMMANWDLHRFKRDLPSLDLPLTLVVGENDRAVPASDARSIRQMLPATTVVSLPGLGHLAHEEDPVSVAEVLFDRIPTTGERAE
jgi:magnesium chelatase accessory protein